MINNIKTLLSSDLLSNYKISKETGIAQSTLSDFTNGRIEIENMRLKYALLLNKVYEKYRGEIELFNKVEELFTDAKSVSEKFGWQVYELGAFTKDGEIDLYIGYKGQGLNEIVHNKEYDDIVKFTDYYHEYAAGIRDLKEAVKLSIDLTMELIQ